MRIIGTIEDKMTDYSYLHNSNILIHVVAGSMVLLLGIVALATKKGGKWQTKSGTISF